MGIMVVYDVSDEKSYINVSKWMTKIKENTGKNVNKILIANKCDLEKKRKVTKERGESLAADLEIPYVEMSALSSSNIDEAFIILTRDRHFEKFSLSNLFLCRVSFHLYQSYNLHVHLLQEAL